MVIGVAAVSRGVGEETESGAGENDSQLERWADEQLAAHGSALNDLRIFTNFGLRRRILRDLLRAPRVSETDLPRQTLEYLIERHIAQTLSGCGLTRLQREVFGLHLRGVSVPEVGRRLGISRQRVAAALRAAREKKRRARDPYEGLQEVYWQEVRRYVYRKPRHAW